MTIVWTEPARADLHHIVKYISQDDPEAAVRFSDRVYEAVNMLAQFPNSGRRGRVPGTRELVVHANYIAVYKLLEDAIAIVNVLHAAQQRPWQR